MKNIPGTKYISKTNKGTFIVQKYINKKMVYFHHSKSLIECLMIRDLLEHNFWDEDCLPIKQTITNEKYIYQDNVGYSIRKIIDGEIIHFGWFRTLDEAIVERDLLIKCSWDFETLCNLPIESESWLIGKFGKNQFQSPINGRIDIRSWE